MGTVSTHRSFVLNHAGLAFLICTAISAVQIGDFEIINVYNYVYWIFILVNKYIYLKSFMVNVYIDYSGVLVYKYVYGLSVQVQRKA